MLQPSYGQQPFSPAQSGNFVGDLTSADLSSHLGTVSSQGGIYVQFFYMKVRIDNPAEPSLHGTYQTRLCVAKQPKGDRLTIATETITPDQAARRWPQEYAAFSQSEAIPTTGTPLHELPGISASQIALLTVYNLRCIEDVAQCPQEHINQMGHEAVHVRTLAVRWLAAKDQNADLIRAAQFDAANSAELERLRKSEEDQRRLITELSAKLDVLMKVGAVPQHTGVTAPGGFIAVDLPDSPDLPQRPSVLFGEGGGDVVTGNEDLLDDPEPVPADPLGIKRKGR